MKLLLMLAMAVIGFIAVRGCRARPQDTAVMVRGAVVATATVALGGIALLLVAPEDIPQVVKALAAGLR